MELDLFLGRFHPLLVHLPIGFIILAIIIETIGLYKKEKQTYDRIVQYALIAVIVSCLITVATGLLLSQGGDYDLDSVNQHKWLGIGVAVYSIVVLVLKIKILKYNRRQSFVVSTIFILLIGLTGHKGGVLTHGDEYLLTYAPDAIKNMAGIEIEDSNKGLQLKNIDSILIYKDLVKPMMEQKCTSCHNNDKQKGDLILSSFKDLEKGGENGQAIVGGNPFESNLFIRTTLPQSSKKFMPPKGAPLTYVEIKVMKWWIEIGASSESKLTEFEIPEEIKQLLLRDYKIDTKPKPYLDQVEVSLLSADKFLLLAESGFEAEPISSIHNFIQVKSNVKKITSDQIQILLAAKEQITWLNLKGKSIDDNMMKTIAKLTNLTTLDLNNNPIGDDGIAELKNLKHLEVLNLYGTEITDKALETIKDLPALKRVYLWQTKVAQAKIDELKKELANIKIIDGISMNLNADN